MKRKPRETSHSTGSRASCKRATEAPPGKARKLKPKFRVGEIVRFRANQVPGENHQWKSGVVTDVIRPGDPKNVWEAQSINYLVLSDRLNAENLMEETITSE
jgi:hypothetical protein